MVVVKGILNGQINYTDAGGYCYNERELTERCSTKEDMVKFFAENWNSVVHVCSHHIQNLRHDRVR